MWLGSDVAAAVVQVSGYRKKKVVTHETVYEIFPPRNTQIEESPFAT